MSEQTRQPDLLKTIEQEMDSDIHPFLKKILDNIKPISWVVGGIIAVAAVYSAVTSYQDRQAAKSASQLGAIITQSDQSAKITQLEAFALSAPGSLRVAVQLELAKIYTEANNYAQAAKAWQAVAGSDLPEMRSIARFGEAQSYIFQREYAKAVDLLTALKQDAIDEYQTAISNALAFAAEKAGQTELALAEYQSLKTTDPSNSSYLDYKIAMLKPKNS